MYYPLQKINGCNGATLLHIACKEGQLDIVHALIEVYSCILFERWLTCENGRFEIMAYFYFSQFLLTYSLQNNHSSGSQEMPPRTDVSKNEYIK